MCPRAKNIVSCTSQIQAFVVNTRKTKYDAKLFFFSLASNPLLSTRQISFYNTALFVLLTIQDGNADNDPSKHCGKLVACE